MGASEVSWPAPWPLDGEDGGGEEVFQISRQREGGQKNFFRAPDAGAVHPDGGELKTKPTQHSVQKLREIGISPDVLLCRADRPIPDEERAKIALFSNVHSNAVISVWDADSIYKVPSMLHKQGMDEIVCFTLGIVSRPADLSAWDRLVFALEHPEHEVKIGMVGKYVRPVGFVQVAQ